jgi:hypothetical protein
MLTLLAVLMLLTSCARHAAETQPASRLTEAQRDTAIARSSLPGASVVGRALDVSGQGTGHAAQMDSLSR